MLSSCVFILNLYYFDVSLLYIDFCVLRFFVCICYCWFRDFHSVPVYVTLISRSHHKVSINSLSFVFFLHTNSRRETKEHYLCSFANLKKVWLSELSSLLVMPIRWIGDSFINLTNCLAGRKVRLAFTMLMYDIKSTPRTHHLCLSCNHTTGGVCKTLRCPPFCVQGHFNGWRLNR